MSGFIAGHFDSHLDQVAFVGGSDDRLTLMTFWHQAKRAAPTVGLTPPSDCPMNLTEQEPLLAG